MLPLIDAAQSNSMSVLVMNPNLRVDPITRAPIRFCQTMESHCNFVWEKYVLPSKFKKLYVIAHSAGGMCLSAIQKKFGKDFYTRVQKIALTDSYATPLSQLTPDQRKWMWKNAVHFVASQKPAGEVISKDSNQNSCIRKSAGHPKHEFTTGYAFDELCKHFKFV